MRETKNISTPNNHKVEIKTYVSKREQREIMSVMNDVEVTMSTDGKAQPKMKFEKASEMEDKTIECLVVSIDGKKENVLETVLDLKSEDCDFILQKLNEVQTGIKKRTRRT